MCASCIETIWKHNDFVKNTSLHNPLNEIFFSKNYMRTYTAGEKSLSGGLHLTTFCLPKCYENI